MNYQKLIETALDRISWGVLVAIGWIIGQWVGGKLPL